MLRRLIWNHPLPALVPLLSRVESAARPEISTYRLCVISVVITIISPVSTRRSLVCLKSQNPAAGCALFVIIRITSPSRRAMIGSILRHHADWDSQSKSRRNSSLLSYSYSWRDLRYDAQWLWSTCTELCEAVCYWSKACLIESRNFVIPSYATSRLYQYCIMHNTAFFGRKTHAMCGS